MRVLRVKRENAPQPNICANIETRGLTLNLGYAFTFFSICLWYNFSVNYHEKQNKDWPILCVGASSLCSLHRNHQTDNAIIME